jgi:hypothetical protein
MHFGQTNARLLYFTLMKKIIAIVAFILVVFFGYRAYQATQVHDHYDTEVHVHTDFAIYVNDQKLDLTADKYQSSLESEKSNDIHLHDNNDHVIHRHAEDITFAQFLNTIGFNLNNSCFVLDNGKEYCADDENILKLYVNGGEVLEPLSYVGQEEDRVLLYYGIPNNPNLQSYLDSVTDESCIPSGTCPERGTPPVESCGLTCDLTVTYEDHTWKEILKFVLLGHF